jgi:hypothetical protein
MRDKYLTAEVAEHTEDSENFLTLISQIDTDLLR